MSIIEFKDDLQVGELKFVRDSELRDKSVSNAEDCNGECDCSEGGTGSDGCTCEDSQQFYRSGRAD